jgi:hypothetical protein
MEIEGIGQGRQEIGMMPFPHHFAKQLSAISSGQTTVNQAKRPGSEKQFVTASGVIFSASSKKLVRVRKSRLTKK